MQKILVLKGLPASGKSTFAKELINNNPGIWKRINKDDLRSMIDNGKWSKSNENFIKKVRDTIVEEALINGFSVIVDDTNLDDSHLKRMKLIANGFKPKSSNIKTVEVEIIDFTDVSVETCLERDRKRNPSVGKDVIMRMYNQFLKPKIKLIDYNPELPDAIICDLDGTLAINDERSPYDTDKCDMDSINTPVAKIITDSFNNNGTKLLLCSGREDKFRKKTESWLWENSIGYSSLFMRKTDDLRNDAIIKKEIYEAEIKDKFNVLFAIDDRKRIKRMWVNEGIFVLDVNQFDEEF